MSYMPINMDINAASLGKQFAHQHEARIHVFEVTHRAFLPKVGIAELLNHRGALHHLTARQGDFCAIVGFAVERRVDVNQVDGTAQRRRSVGRVALQQGLHGEHVVAIDEAVVPRLVKVLVGGLSAP